MARNADDVSGERDTLPSASPAPDVMRPRSEGATKRAPRPVTQALVEVDAPTGAPKGDAGGSAGPGPVGDAVPAMPAHPVPAAGEEEAATDNGATSGGGFLAATHPFQDFATLTQRMARESFDETTKLMGQIRGARNPAEIVLLQTTYMQHTLRMCTEFAGRLGALFAASQTNLIKQGQATIEGFGSTDKP